VALKLMSSRATDRSLRARMERELRLARDLRHPNIVRVDELLELGDHHCLVMELVPGRTLKQRIASDGPVPFEEAGAILAGLASALAAVHAGGIVHRDLKPQNVIVTPEGVVKLLDFGLAKTPDSTGLTATGTILGTPDYMAPEQVDGATASERSDLYALGVIGYELVTGRPPFTGDSPLAVALQHVRSRVPDPALERADVPPRLARLIARLTEPMPSARPESAAAVLAELEALRQDPSGGLAEPTRRWRPARAVTAAAILVAGAGASWWAIRDSRSAATLDPLADGVLHVAVTSRPALGMVGGDLFLEALGEALVRRLEPPTFVVTPGDDRDRRALARGGVEHLLELALAPEVREDGSRSFRLAATIRDVDLDEPWRELAAVTLPGLDFEGVDVASTRLVEAYQRAVETELAARETAAQGR
jgi:hypothetical protein